MNKNKTMTMPDRQYRYPIDLILIWLTNVKSIIELYIRGS